MRDTSRGRCGVAAALVAVLVAIAAIGPTLGPADTTPALAWPEPMAATNAPPFASPTAVIPTPLPLASPMPVIPTPSATEEPAEATPTEPGIYASVQTIASVIVAIDEHGIWTRDDGAEQWTLTPAREQDHRACHIRAADSIAFVYGESAATATISRFDPALPGWVTDSAESLPPLPESQSLGPDGFCQGVALPDGRLVFTAATDAALVFAVEQLDGSFEPTTVSHPDRWFRGDIPMFVEARTLRHHDAIIVAQCSYYFDTGCLMTHFRFGPVVARSDGPTEMSWTEAGGEVILPSPNADVTVYADLGGSIDRGFELTQVGDEVWAEELTEKLGSNQGPDFSTPVGRWSVSPLGVPPVPLGTGYWPLLSANGDTVVARMVALGEPTLGGAWNPQAAEGRPNVDQWWAFDRDASRWQPLAGDPVEVPPVLGERPFLDVRLEWSRNQPVGSTAGPAQTSERRSWDEVVGDGAPVIAADRAFVMGGVYKLWLTTRLRDPH